jgi:hypothetical protein
MYPSKTTPGGPTIKNEAIRHQGVVFTLHASRFTLHASRFTLHASRFTLHASRFTLHASRFTLHAYDSDESHRGNATHPANFFHL